MTTDNIIHVLPVHDDAAEIAALRTELEPARFATELSHDALDAGNAMLAEVFMHAARHLHKEATEQQQQSQPDDLTKRLDRIEANLDGILAMLIDRQA
jgi:hypothetical protein